jgi:hypothetical protein
LKEVRDFIERFLCSKKINEDDFAHVKVDKR